MKVPNTRPLRSLKKGRVLGTGARIGYNLGNLNEEWAFKSLFRCILIAKIANISAYSAKKQLKMFRNTQNSLALVKVHIRKSEGARIGYRGAYWVQFRKTKKRARIGYRGAYWGGRVLGTFTV